MNELALFAGAGGGILGGHLLGWRTRCAVEIDAHARSILLARQRDGVLPRFPIWDDIRNFDGRPWRGSIDVVSGGFPCQPFSTAARGRNVAEDLWPQMLRVVDEVAPRFVFAENVLRDPIERAASDLRALGYHPRFTSLDAAEMGGPHSRPRWWLVADAHGESKPRRTVDAEVAGVRDLAGLAWWQNEPRDLGVHDGLANRMDRLRTIGNGQVPAVAAATWLLLTEGIGK